MLAKFRDNIGALTGRQRVGLCLAFTLVVFIALQGRQVLPATLFVVLWSSFSITLLGLDWWAFYWADVAHVRRMATREDPGRLFTFAFVILAACASLVAVTLLLGEAKELMDGFAKISHIVLSITAVTASWCLVHTVFAFRYAHVFYGADKKQAGGLTFPSTEEPDYVDFVYFSFVLGMTCQVSDVQITNRRFRRLALLHGILSFAFNTVIVALTINLLSSLL